MKSADVMCSGCSSNMDRVVWVETRCVKGLIVLKMAGFLCDEQWKDRLSTSKHNDNLGVVKQLIYYNWWIIGYAIGIELNKSYGLAFSVTTIF